MPPPPLRTQVDQLSALLGQMCTAAAAALQHATSALVENRTRLAEQVVAGDCRIDALRDQVEEIATDALLFHQPVAGDLRAVVAAIRSAGDIERMGDLALHVAEVALRDRDIPAEVRTDFVEMSRLAVALALKAADVVRSRNVLLAVELDQADDAMDALHSGMFETMMAPTWTHGVPAAVDVTLLARYYERFADHAVTVANGTVYAVTGREPDAIPI